jgi:hypothetical protein
MDDGSCTLFSWNESVDQSSEAVPYKAEIGKGDFLLTAVLPTSACLSKLPLPSLRCKGSESKQERVPLRPKPSTNQVVSRLLSFGRLRH